MREKRRKIMKATIGGILVGLIVLCSGFGVMYCLWRKIGTSGELPGLFAYRAATIGDGICLPVLAGALVALAEINRRLTLMERRICLLGAGIMAVIGTGIQASWLISDKTKVNWSIPIQHYFNVAGWYHSLFFIGMFGFLTYQFIRIFFILREKREDVPWFEKVIVMILVAAGSTFIYMYLFDDYKAAVPVPYLFSIGVVCISTFLAIAVKMALGKFEENILFAVFAGAVPAYGYSLMMCLDGDGDTILALCGALSICFVIRIEKLSFGKMFFMYMWTMPCYFCALYGASSIANMGGCLCVLVIVGVLTLVIERMLLGEIRLRGLGIILISAYILKGKCVINGVWYDKWIEIVFIGTIYVIFKKEIQSTFAMLTDAEVKKNQNKLQEDVFKRLKASVYFQIVIGIIIIAILLCRWLIDISQNKGKGFDVGNIWISSSFMIGIFVGSVTLAVLGNRKIRKYTVSRILTSMVLALIFILLIVNIAFGLKDIEILSWNPVNCAMIICSICACLGTPAMVAHGYYMNIVELRENRKDGMVNLLAGMLFAGCSILLVEIVLLIISTPNLANLIISVVSAVIAFEILPVLSARVVTRNGKPSHVVPNSDIGGIAQDGLMFVLIVMFVIVMPCAYISIMKTVDGEVLLGAFALFSSAFLPVKFCLRNNVEHMMRQREVLIRYPQEKDIWNRLHRNLVIQSWQTVFAMLPYVTIVVLGIIGSCMTKNMTLKEMKNHLIGTYIDGCVLEEEI